MVVYLKALASRHRKSIQKVNVTYIIGRSPATAFNVLSTCSSLRRLSLDITLLAHYFNIPLANRLSEVPGFGELSALRGLETVTLMVTRKAIPETGLA